MDVLLCHDRIAAAPPPFQEMQQHDVQELNRILFDALESSLIGTSGHQMIRKLFHGTSVQQVGT